MRRISTALLSFVLLFGLLVPSAGSEPIQPSPLPAVTNGSSLFGIVEAFQAPELAKRSGAKWQRIAFFWNSIQPDNADQWLPNHYNTDADINRSIADGIEPVGLIGNPPAWATRNGSTPKGLNLPLGNPNNYWAEFVTKLANKYEGKIDSWIIWNEPDIPPDMPLSSWGGELDEYFQLQKVAYQAIHAANPEAKVIFAGTTYWYDRWRGNKQFFERYLEMAAARDPLAARNSYYLDAVDVHLYSSPAHIYNIPADFRAIMARHGLNKPIWISEMNIVPTDDPVSTVPRGAHRGSLDEQASYVVQSMALARVSGVEKVAFYKMRDTTVISGEPYGLVRNDLSVRPAYVAFQVGAGYLSDPGQVSIEHPTGYDKVIINGEKRRVTVIWAVGPNPTTAIIPINGGKAKLIAKDGAVTSPAFIPGKLEYEIWIPGATCNTDPGDPNFYLIGGSPLLLVEDLSDGDGIEISPTELYFPKTGFSSKDAFLDYFRHRGGLRTFGYPISRSFKLNGATVQFYQRQVMELRADGTVGLINLLDEGVMPYTKVNGAVFPGIDTPLTKTAPAPGSADYSGKILKYVSDNTPNLWKDLKVRFGDTFQGTVTLNDAFSEAADKKGKENLVLGMNLELWGVPTSKLAADPTNADFVYLRFQRGIMHFDKKTGATQGLLLADYLKSIITSQNLPPDLDAQAKSSNLYKQYDNTKPQGLARPTELPNTDMKDAFERGR